MVAFGSAAWRHAPREDRHHGPGGEAEAVDVEPLPRRLRAVPAGHQRRAGRARPQGARDRRGLAPPAAVRLCQEDRVQLHPAGGGRLHPRSHRRRARGTRAASLSWRRVPATAPTTSTSSSPRTGPPARRDRAGLDRPEWHCVSSAPTTGPGRTTPSSPPCTRTTRPSPAADACSVAWAGAAGQDRRDVGGGGGHGVPLRQGRRPRQPAAPAGARRGRAGRVVPGRSSEPGEDRRRLGHRFRRSTSSGVVWANTVRNRAATISVLARGTVDNKLRA